MKDRLNAAKKYLIGIGAIDKQSDIAKVMSSSESSISRAFSGDERYLTNSFMRRFNNAFGGLFNLDWLMFGHGDMLRSGNTATASHSPNAIVNAGDHVSIVGHTTQNSYGDSPEKERKWRPVVPNNVASLPEIDIVDYISERETEGQRMERLYSGQAPVDLWLQMSDRSLEPYIMQGDYLGLKAYPKGVYNIFQGDVYAIDTRYDGLKVRVIKNGGTDGTLMACSYNKADYPDQEISKADIIRVYKKVLMFRY